MSTTIDHLEDVDDLPPSARFVVFVLEAEGGSLRREELQEETGHPRSTLDHALQRLEDEGIIRRDRDAEGGDLRYVRVELADTA